MSVRRWLNYVGLPLLAGLVLATAPAPAEASSLDKALLNNTGDVLEYLKKNKIKNVGVLPFQVKRGARDASVGTTPLSTNLPERIENALIMIMDPTDEKRAIGVIRGATATATKAGAGAYRTDKTAYDKLFSTEYNLAWGGKKVKADAFLTGTVVNAGDRGETVVQVQILTPKSFDKSKLALKKVTEFKSRTDAVLAADLGYNFALSRGAGALKRGLKAVRRDGDVVAQVEGEDEKGEKKAAGLASPDHSPSNIAGFEYELYYNGAKQTLTASAGKEGAKQVEYSAPTPPAGATITMYMKRLDGGPHTLGVLLMVNGKSTFNKEDGDPYSCRKWIYAPKATGRRDLWEGFYMGSKGEDKLTFRAATAAESEAKMDEMGGKGGMIEIYVFGTKEEKGGKDDDDKKDVTKDDDDKKDEKKDEKKDDVDKKDDDDKKEEKKDDKKAKDGDKKDKDDDELTITTRGMVSRPRNDLSLKNLRSRLFKANNVKERERLVAKRSVGGLILHDMEAVKGAGFPTADLPDPVLIGHLTIRYYQKSAGGEVPTTDDP